MNLSEAGKFISALMGGLAVMSHVTKWKNTYISHLQLRIDWSRIRYHPNGSAGLRFPGPIGAGANKQHHRGLTSGLADVILPVTENPAGGRRTCHKRKPRQGTSCDDDGRAGGF